MFKIDGKIHICRARCDQCVSGYLIRKVNKCKLYYIQPQYVPKELMCNNH